MSGYHPSHHERVKMLLGLCQHSRSCALRAARAAARSLPCYSSAQAQLSSAEQPGIWEHFGWQGLCHQTQARKCCPLPQHPSCGHQEHRSHSPGWLTAMAPWEDTALHHPVLQPSQVLHHDVDEAGDEASEDADHGTDDPALDLHCPESLRGTEPSEPTAAQPGPCQQQGDPSPPSHLPQHSSKPGSSPRSWKANTGSPRIAKPGRAPLWDPQQQAAFPACLPLSGPSCWASCCSKTPKAPRADVSCCSRSPSAQRPTPCHWLPCACRLAPI